MAFTFDKIDAECKKFPTRQITDSQIMGAHTEDRVARPGISIVIGCPLPTNLQRRILAVQSQVQGAPVRWRKDLGALHITVYGLVKPDDYRRLSSWPLAAPLIRVVRSIVYHGLPFALRLHGLCVLGRAAIAVRVSDSQELDTIRERIESLPGVSARAFGERINQMIIGRLLPPLSDQARADIQNALNTLKTTDAGHIGDIGVTSVELVHYKHEFLDRVYDQEPL